MKIRTALFAAEGLKKAIESMESDMKIKLKDLNEDAQSYFDECDKSDKQGVKDLQGLIKRLFAEAVE